METTEKTEEPSDDVKDTWDASSSDEESEATTPPAGMFL